MSIIVKIISLFHTVPDPCLSDPCHVNAMCTRDNLLTTDLTCRCNFPFVGDGFNCESKLVVELLSNNNRLIISLSHTVPDPCSSSPCDLSATCRRHSVTTESFACTCNSPLVGDGFSCEGIGLAIVLWGLIGFNSQSLVQVYVILAHVM